MQQDSGLTWYQVAGLLAAIGGSTALGWQGCKKMNAIRIEPQPLEVKRIAECATRKELENFKADVREDIRRIHNRIDSNDRATAAFARLYWRSWPIPRAGICSRRKRLPPPCG